MFFFSVSRMPGAGMSERKDELFAWNVVKSILGTHQEMWEYRSKAIMSG